MKEVFTVVSVICAASLLCTLVSTFITDSGTKKIVNLVLGAFMICCLIMPVKSALTGFNADVSQSKAQQGASATSDEAYSRAVIGKTKENLEKTLNDMLLQRNIKINKCEIILAQSKDKSIIISSVSIYINKEYLQQSDTISSVTVDNFGIQPNILTE